jgi:hypothetical protein
MCYNVSVHVCVCVGGLSNNVHVCGGLGVGGHGYPHGSVPDLMLSELVNFINPTFSSYRHSLSSIACGMDH